MLFLDKLISVLEETNHLLSQNFNNSTLEIISIVISGVALIFAIFVPIRIADKQNKIALFEKRFEAYSNLLKLKAFSELLKKEECSFDSKIIMATGRDFEGEKYRRCNEVLLNFQTFFHNGEQKPDSMNVARITLYTVRNLELSLQTLPMLYSKKLVNKGEDANKEITKIFEDFTWFMISLTEAGGPQSDKRRTDFVANMNAFVDKYADVFEKEVRL